MELNLPSHDSLEKFENINYYELIKNILNDIIDNYLDSQRIFKNINDLRRFNKYEKPAFILIFNVLYEHISHLIINQNEEIVCVTLTLIKELFENSWNNHHEVNDWFVCIIPNILLVSNSESTNKELAFECLYICTNNFIYEETFVTLLNRLVNDKISEDSFSILKFIFLNSNKELLLNMYWTDILNTMTNVFTKNSNYIISLCLILKDKFDKDELFYILSMADKSDLIILEFFEFNDSDRIELFKVRENILINS